MRIGVYHILDPANVAHPDGERITADMLADTFSHDMRFSVRSPNLSRANLRPLGPARRGGLSPVRLREGQRDAAITSDLRFRDGIESGNLHVLRNDRYASALRRLAS